MRFFSSIACLEAIERQLISFEFVALFEGKYIFKNIAASTISNFT